MRISNLFESKKRWLYHLTSIRAIINIISKSRFVLSKEDDSWYISFATSIRSGFFTFMVPTDLGGSVLLIIDNNELSKFLIVEPYHNPMGLVTLLSYGVSSPEYEVRATSSSKVVHIPNVSTLIKEIRIFDKEKRPKRGLNSYTDEDLEELKTLCASARIAFTIHDNKKTFLTKF